MPEQPTPTERPADTPVPTSAAPAAVVATAVPEPTPIPPTPTPEATAPPAMTEEGCWRSMPPQWPTAPAPFSSATPPSPPPTPNSSARRFTRDWYSCRRVSDTAGGQFQQMFQIGLFGLEQLGVPGHQFIYTSGYYQELIEKANLLNPTEANFLGRGHRQSSTSAFPATCPPA